MDRYYRLAAGVACDLTHNGGLHPCRWAAIHGEATTGYPRPCPDGLCSNHRAPPGHDSRRCLGNCKEHPLVTGDFAVMWILENAAGHSELWGRMTVDEEDEWAAAEPPEVRAAREAKELAAAAAAAEAAAIQKKAARWTSDGEAMKFRVPRPCRYASFHAKRLCVGCDKEGIRTVIPEGQTECRAVIPAHTRKNHMGDTVPVPARVCGEPFSGCHNHANKTCIYVHPDEPQWADACSGRLDVLACKSWCEAKRKGDGVCICRNRLIFCHASDPAAARNNAPAPHRGGAPVRGISQRGAPHRGSQQERARPPPPVGAPNRFAAALAPVQAQQPAKQQLAKPQSRFGSFDDSSDEEDRSAW
jgi:hypothetical protein